MNFWLKFSVCEKIIWREALAGWLAGWLSRAYVTNETIYVWVLGLERLIERLRERERIHENYGLHIASIMYVFS